jgi:amyloid beta precursor protein binding protein 1
VIDTHPETTVDLRLTRPWPALSAYAADYKVDGIDSMEQSHIPFVVILLRKLEEWKQNNAGILPKPSKDRKAFQDLINTFRKTDNADAENVDEAIGALGQHVWRPITLSQDGIVPPETQALLQDEACTNVNEKVSSSPLLIGHSCANLSRAVF